jgi:hypothetical protein
MRLFDWRALLGLSVVATALVFGAGNASAAFHGIGVTKGCTSPVKIGDQYTCSVQIQNIVDTGHDTLRVTGLTDVVHSAGGDVPGGVPPNMLASTGLVFGGAVTCSGGSGAGTSADPYLGATSCLMPFGTSITTKPFSHYVVQANDFNLVNHRLTDTATVGWNNTCTSNPDNDCATGPQFAGAGSSALVQKLSSATATNIHDAGHNTVTAVAVSSTVHDFVTVTGEPSKPTPTGNVTIDWFLNNTCSGSPQSNSGNLALNASGQLDATGFAFTVNTPGLRGFRAHYLGDATYDPSDGACEPLRVVDASIQISPLTATNEVGTTHTFTAHVNVNNGTGWENVYGALVNFSIDSGPGTLSNGNFSSSQCVTDTSGNCTIDLNSSTPGVTTLSGHTGIITFGVTIFRSTDSTGMNSGPAVKTWVDANIQITPQLATNPVGVNHVFTGHVNINTGTGGYVNAPDGTQISFTIDSGPGSFTTANPCTTAGGTGSCTITLTSATAGTTVVSAHTTVSVGGVSLTRHTNGSGANSGPATKLWADDTVVTEIRNASNTVITSAVPGVVVHDRVNVARTAGTPAAVLANPTGNVTFRRYTSTVNCTGAHVDTVSALTPGNPSTADSPAFTVTGPMSYQADYAGDANYPAHTGACEPLSVITVGPCTLGYPDSSHNPRSSAVFNESEVLRGFSTNGSGGAATISAWYSDEHALTLGVDPDPDGTPVTPMVGTAAQHAANPDIGDVTATDGAGRPLYPAAFVTDITNTASSRLGDWQQRNNNDNAQGPQDLFGTWKDAIKSGSTISPGADPPANSTYGPGADTPPAGLSSQKYRTEIRWNLSSLRDENGNMVSAGHAYRILFMVHDGDQNHTGGDVGEACVNLVFP